MDQNPPKRRGRPSKASTAAVKPQKKSRGKAPATGRGSGRQPRSSQLAALFKNSAPVTGLADYQITLVDVTASYKDGVFIISGLRRGMLDVAPWCAEIDDLDESPPAAKRSFPEDQTKEAS